MDFLRALFPRQTPAARSAKQAVVRRPRRAATRHVSPGGKDAALTRSAAEMLRELGCEEMAARVAVVWSGRLTSTAGHAKPAEGLVALNPRLREFPEEVDRTLRHEVAHLVVFAKAKGRRVAAHGSEWRGACALLGIPGEARCHHLPLPRRQMARPHVYGCPRCDFVVRRVKPLRAPGRVACRTCCQQFAGGRFDARFGLVKRRE